MKWLSIDPAKGVTGIAEWEDSTLVSSYVIKKRGTKGAYYLGRDILSSEFEAWDVALDGVEHVIYERAYGSRMNVAVAQGRMYGWIEHACLSRGIDRPKELHVKEWRRVIGEECSVTFSNTRDKAKATAISVVKQLYNIDPTEDECEAILIGRAALRLRMVEVYP